MTRSLHPFFLMLLMATCLPDLAAKAFTPQPGTPLRTALPRWNLIQKSDGEWRVVDHLDKIRKYYRNDEEFWGAIDMNAEAVARLQKEMPELPKDIFPN